MDMAVVLWEEGLHLWIYKQEKLIKYGIILCMVCDASLRVSKNAWSMKKLEWRQ